jgi:hypothetical protein
MLWQSLWALALASVTVILHAVGTANIAIPAAGVLRSPADSRHGRRPVPGLILLVGMLLVLHLVEMAVWAGAYFSVGVFPDFEASLYYSLTSYTTVGYGDILPDKTWRLLGPLEAAVGVLMLGWSTSVIVAAVQRSYNVRSASIAPPA